MRRRAQPPADHRRPARHRRRRRAPKCSIGSTTLRLDGGTEVEVAAARRRPHRAAAAQRQRWRLRLRSSESAREFELDTGEGPLRAAARRAATASTASTRPATSRVWPGQALYEGRGSALTVNAGQRAEFWLDAQRRAVRISGHAAARRFRRLGRRDATAPTTAARRPLCLARDDRRRGPRPPRPLGAAPRVRRASGSRACVAAGWAPYRYGHWAWVRALGLDLGRRRALGLRAVPLRPLGLLAQQLVLGAGHATCARPVYAPALVAWVGGPRVSVSAQRRRPGRRSAGCRSRRARSTCRATASASATCATSTSRTSPTSPTSPTSSTARRAQQIMYAQPQVARRGDRGAGRT